MNGWAIFSPSFAVFIVFARLQMPQTTKTRKMKQGSIVFMDFAFDKRQI
jgi:hypothetical protein